MSEDPGVLIERLAEDLGGQISVLSERVTELEARLAEAGRRALFHAEREGIPLADGAGPTVYLADVGRALLFDTETP